MGELMLSTKSLPASIINDNHRHQSLFSIPALVNTGCTAIFNRTSSTMTDDDSRKLVAHGTKHPTDTFWTINLQPSSSPILPPSTSQANLTINNNTAKTLVQFIHMPQANLVVKYTSVASFVQFVHATFGSHPVSTFLKAANAGYLSNYPRITAKMISAHPPNSIATALGHLDQTRQGQHSTLPTSPVLISTDPLINDTSSLFFKVIPISETNHSDLTGRLPIASRKGNQYLLISVYNGYIHMEPMVSKLSS
jgi:hypothetical protein